jgi:hypothetical protein
MIFRLFFLKTMMTNCEVTTSTVEGKRFRAAFGAAEF